MAADITRLLQPVKDRRPLPAVLVDHRLAAGRQYAGNIFPEAAAGQVGQGVHVMVGDQIQTGGDVDLGRREQMVGQRTPRQLGVTRVATANLQDLADQGVAIGVGAAGCQGDQGVAGAYLAAVDDL